MDTGQCEAHYDIENDKTTQWHEKEREGERKKGGGGKQRIETTSIMNKTKRNQKWLWTRLENDAYRSRGEESKKVSDEREIRKRSEVKR